MKDSTVKGKGWAVLDWDGRVVAAHGDGHPHTLVLLRNPSDSPAGQEEIETAREQVRAVQRERDKMPAILPDGLVFLVENRPKRG